MSTPSPPPSPSPPPEEDSTSPLQLIGKLAFNSSLITESNVDAKVAVFGSVGAVGVGIILLSLLLVNAAGTPALPPPPAPVPAHLPRALCPPEPRPHVLSLSTHARYDASIATHPETGVSLSQASP